jgi:hypothetical protein
MPRRKRCEITERDYKIFRFIWKWKIISTAALAKKFFPKAHAFSAYRRLLRLASGGYIESVVISGRFNEAWILKEKGFRYILPHLGYLRSEGYRSANYNHDFLASAFHLGEWLTEQPKESQTYTEQQLRCFPADLWPDWVPQSSLHRPDGYTAYDSNGKRTVIAFEVELSPKDYKRYESVSTFYDNQPSINMVFWLVDGKSTLNALRRRFEKQQLREWSKHHFILLEDFIKLGWSARFVEGKLIARSPFDILCLNTTTKGSQSALNCRTLALLDSRRRPLYSKPYANLKKSKNP